MTELTLKRLLGVFAIAVAVWVVSSLLSGGGSGAITAPGEISGFFDGVDATTVTAIDIERNGETVRLEPQDGDWRVNGFPADTANVSRFLRVLDSAQVGDLIANNPGNHERMGLSPDSASSVALTMNDGSSRTILLGKAGQRFRTAFVRLPDDDAVYLLDGDLRAHVNRTLEIWRNRNMVAIDTTRVARVEVDAQDGGYAIVRGDSLWTVEGGGEVGRSALNGIMAELHLFVASGFVAEGDSIAGLEGATTTRALSESGELMAEVTISDGAGDRWATTQSDDYLYRVTSFRAGRIAPTREALEPPPP